MKPIARTAAICCGAALAVVLGSDPLASQGRPEGWDVRFDSPDATEDQLEVFEVMDPGWHVTTGPRAIFSGPEMSAAGSYRLEMEVFLFDPGGRREAFGIFFGGQDLMGDEVEYSYFLIRDGGEFIVKRREGAETPTLLPWTGHEAILGYADRGEAATAKNVLAVEVDAGMARFYVNGAEVASLARSEVPADGRFGFRVNHALNLHISRMEMVEM